MTRLDAVEVGEAVPLYVSEVFDLTGATLTARVSVNGGTVSTHTGTLDLPIGGEITTGVIWIPGTTITAAGWAQGDVQITHATAPWSPKIERFEFRINAAV